MNNSILAAYIAGKAARGAVIFLIGMVLLAIAIAAVACGGDAENRSPSLPVGPATLQPAGTPDAVSTSTEAQLSTPEPSPPQIPTSTPLPAPASEAAASQTPARVASSTPVPEIKVEDSNQTAEDAMATELPPECLADGTLTDPKVIFSCSGDAMDRLQTVRVDLDLNLGALFGLELPPDSESVGIQMKVARVFPDEFSIIVSGPKGELIHFILADGETYAKDATSGEWVRIPQSEEGFGDSNNIDIVGALLSWGKLDQQVQELDNPEIAWKEFMLTAQGSKYIVSYLSSLPSFEQLGMSEPLEVQLTIDAGTFLQDSGILLMRDPEGTSLKIAEFQYSSHNEPFTIDAPESYIEADASMIPPGSGSIGGNSEVPEVVALTKNGNGDVEVTFSDPVTLIGDVGLYVLEPSTGGWSLAYIDGSGTETLIFAAASADNPPLVPGESRIVGFTFDSPESDLVDEDGQVANPTFEEWVYPE